MKLSQVRPDEKGIPTLYVDGKPFFVRGGEIHNSSASDLDYMRKEVWPRLRGLNLNTVIVPVYWELIEPEQDQFDFSVVDSLLVQAREEGLRLGLLWFGLWKNAESFYVPAWMKRDSETYFRARKVSGEPLNTVSPLCAAAVERDAAAFAALMRHLRETDGETGTVILVQVENEIGLLGTDRDYGTAANTAYARSVPAALGTGDWQSVFGEAAAESFMAWHFASAVETIATAGIAEYPLPCYANAWLKQYPWYAGSYPSGGPVPAMRRIWKTAAPSLFTLAPDIYVPYCADVMDEYTAPENPLFIPEIRKDAVTASYALYAFGAKDAIGYSPFGIEELALDPAEIDKPPAEVMAALNIDPSAFDITGSKDYLAATYGLLRELEPLLLQYRGTAKLRGYVRHGDTDYGCFLRFTDYDVTVSYAPKLPAKPLGAGLLFELEPERFLAVGMMQGLEFRVKPGVDRKCGILRYEEGTVSRGQWVPGRVLNGDEQMSIRFGDRPECRMITLFQY